MSKQDIIWQKKHIKQCKELLKYNMRAAYEKAKYLGRPLTDKEFESFRLKPNVDFVPVKKLVVKANKYLAV